MGHRLSLADQDFRYSAAAGRANAVLHLHGFDDQHDLSSFDFIAGFDKRTGKQLWKKDLGAYSTMFGHGTGSSPIIHDGKIYIQCDNEEKSFLVALDKKTGEQKWKADRREKSGWSTPYMWKTKDRTDLVAGTAPTARQGPHRPPVPLARQVIRPRSPA